MPHVGVFSCSHYFLTHHGNGQIIRPNRTAQKKLKTIPHFFTSHSHYLAYPNEALYPKLNELNFFQFVRSHTALPGDYRVTTQKYRSLQLSPALVTTFSKPLTHLPKVEPLFSGILSNSPFPLPVIGHIVFRMLHRFRIVNYSPL